MHTKEVLGGDFGADRSRSRETGGFGLGLAIAREVVHLHGGDITVESERGEGTQFLVSFPLRRAGAAKGEDDPVAVT